MKKRHYAALTIWGVLLGTAVFLNGCQGPDDAAAGSKPAAQPAGDIQETISASEEPKTAEDRELTFQGRLLEQEEAALYERLLEESGGEILLFQSGDFDGDGSCEAFGFTGNEKDGSLKGTSWFLSQDGVQRLREGTEPEYVQKTDAVLTAGEEKFWYTESDGGSSTVSWLWGVKNGKPVESVISGKGMNLTQTGDSFILYQNDWDGMTDGTGHTLKPCYFFYENQAFHEYGALELDRGELLSLSGAKECLDYVEKNAGWISSVYLRANGMIQVNLTDGTKNWNVTLAAENGALCVSGENAGIAGLLIGGIMDAGWRSQDGELKRLWEKKLETDQNPVHRLRPGSIAYYDLDGDGVQEEIWYQVTEQEENGGVLLNLSVNGEEAYGGDTAYATGYRVMISDLELSDGKKELAVERLEDSGCFSELKFLRCENGGPLELFDLKGAPAMGGVGSFNRIGQSPDSRGELYTPGDGTLTVWADTPVITQGLGSYYVKLSYDCTKGGIREIIPEEYEIYALYTEEKQYPYTAAAEILLYKTAGEYGDGVPVFTVLPGETLYCDAILPDGPQTVYARLRSQKGDKEGWTLLGEEAVFEETPAWG